MTQQIINVGTGPDSYTGESLRTAFQKVNDNFSQLYAGNVGANISGNIITANGFVTSGNVVAGNVTAAGNISAYYFTGDGSQLTGITVSANTGNISFSNLTISGSVAGNIVLDPAGDGNVNVLSTIRTQAVRVGNVNNTEFAIDILGNTASISTAGRGNGNVSLRLAANNNGKGSITIRADDGHIGFGIPPDGYEYAFNGEVRANAYYADADFPVGYQFTTPGGDTGMTHDYQNDINGNVSVVIIKHDSFAAVKFYDNNHTIMSGNLVVSQTGNVFGPAYPDAFMQAYANVNSYSQTIIQNLNSGNLASSDVVATADNGNDNSHYINMGMASSTYTVAGFDVVGPNDGYLYVAGDSYAGPFSNTSNLNIGSTTGSVRTWIGQGTAANVVTTVSPGSFTVNGTISTTGNIIPGANVTYNLGSSTRQWKDLWLSNSTMYLGGFPVTVSNTGVLSVNGSPVSSSYGNANVKTYLATPVGFDDGYQRTIEGYYANLELGATARLYSYGSSAASFLGHDGFANININYVRAGQSDIQIATNNAAYTWTFNNAGNLTLPGATAGETIATQGGYITVGNLLIGQGGALFNSNNDSWALYGNISDPGATILIPSNTAADNGTPLYIESQQSNVEIRSGSSTWRFGTDGTTTFPTNISIDYSGGNVQFPRIIADTGKAFSVQGQGNIGSAALAWTVDPNSASQYAQVGVTRGGGDNLAKVVLTAQSNSGDAATAKTWQFNETGTTRFPGDIILAPAGQSITMQSDQYSQLMWENANVTVAPNMAINSNFYVAQNNATLDIVYRDGNSTQQQKSWLWGVDGTLTLPTAGRINFDYLSISSDANVSAFYAPAGNVQLAAGTGNAQIVANSLNDSKTWIFGTDGNLALPHSGVLLVSGGITAGPTIASPAPYLSGFSSISAVSMSASGNISSGNMSTGVITLTNGAVIKDNAGDSVAFGQSAGATSQGNSAVAIGHNAGVTSQGTFTVAIGRNAGQTSQGGSSVAVGVSAGDVSQGAQAVAVGNGAGGGNQGNSAVAIGVGAGQSTQGVEAVAIGNSAGSLTQGISAIAIGKGAGRYFQGNNSIIINATGADLDQTTANTFTVAPVRNDVANVAEILFYNTTSKEVTYGNTISVAGNITGGNIITAGNITGNTGGFAIGYRDIPQVVFTSNATLALTDAGKHYFSSNSANVITVPNNTSVSFSIGTAISIVQQGTASLTVTPGSGVTLYLAGNSTPSARTLGNYGMATLMKVGTDTWFINGTGVS